MSRRELANLIERHPEIPRERWGKDGAKSLLDLHEEITAHLSRLVEEDGQLVREITEVQVRITHKSLALTRTVRRTAKRAPPVRPPPLASMKKKVMRALDPRICAIRALKEEFGVPSHYTDKGLILLSYAENELEEPTTYPGLPTRRRILTFAYEMPDLYFKRKGYVVKTPKKVVTYRWGRRKPWDD